MRYFFLYLHSVYGVADGLQSPLRRASARAAVCAAAPIGWCLSGAVRACGPACHDNDNQSTTSADCCRVLDSTTSTCTNLRVFVRAATNEKGPSAYAYIHHVAAAPVHILVLELSFHAAPRELRSAGPAPRWRHACRAGGNARRPRPAAAIIEATQSNQALRRPFRRRPGSAPLGRDPRQAGRQRRGGEGPGPAGEHR